MADEIGLGAIRELSNVDLGRYHLGKRIGSGGMGEVYEATDTLLKRKVALKRLLPRYASDHPDKHRLIREARALSAVSHPNVAALYDVIESQGEAFLVMELVSGMPLLPARQTPMDLDTFLVVARQCAEALEAAHARGIVHGDLKPSNVYLDGSGRIKVLDFGLARWFESSEASTASSESLDESGRIYGTLSYSAPEVLRGHQGDERRDLFALGLIYYELLTGEHPFRADNLSTIVARILNEVPPAPSARNPEVPGALDAVIGRLLEKEPSHRYATATQVLKDLRCLEIASPYASTRSRSRYPEPARRAPSRVLRISMLLILLLGLGVLSYRRFLKPSPVFAERNWVLVADFENSTGNAVFDQTLSEGLNLSLQQSRYVNVYPRSQVFDSLKRMSRTGIQRIDESVGREVCQRENLHLLLMGSIRRSGNVYQMSLQAVQPASGAVLFVERVQFDKSDQLFEKVDALAKRVRTQLGESASHFEKTSRPLARVTTPSLDALQRYSEASDALARGKTEQARVLLLSALTFDPNFAMAHWLLANVYFSLGIPEKHTWHLKRSYELRASVTDRERYMIEAGYLGWMGDVDKGAEILKVLISLYPDDIGARAALASCYREAGQLSAAIAEFRQVIRLNPYDSSANGKLMHLLIRANESGNAVQSYRQAAKRGIKGPELDWALGMAFLVQGNQQDALRQFQQLQEEAGYYQVLGEIGQARAAIYDGKFKEAIEQLNSGIASDQRYGRKYPESLRRYFLAHAFFVRGEKDLAAGHLRNILSNSPEDLQAEDVRRAGSLYARIGGIPEAEQALKMLESMLNKNPVPFEKSCFLNLQGELFLARGDSIRAAQSFEAADAELRRFVSHHGLARAYLQSGDPDRAAAEWMRVLQSRGEVFYDDSPAEWVLAHLELARLYRGQNQTDPARKYYEQFLKIWQASDAGSVMDQAARELRELTTQSSTKEVKQSSTWPAKGFSTS